MVKHIVMWKIEAPEGKEQQQVLEDIKRELEGLVGQIEGTLSMEVGFNFNPSDKAYDVVLYSTFTNREALAYYQQHEKHQYIANTFVKPFAVARSVVDYEI